MPDENQRNREPGRTGIDRSRGCATDSVAISLNGLESDRPRSRPGTVPSSYPTPVRRRTSVIFDCQRHGSPIPLKVLAFANYALCNFFPWFFLFRVLCSVSPAGFSIILVYRAVSIDTGACDRVRSALPSFETRCRSFTESNVKYCRVRGTVMKIGRATGFRLLVLARKNDGKQSK